MEITHQNVCQQEQRFVPEGYFISCEDFLDSASYPKL